MWQTSERRKVRTTFSSRRFDKLEFVATPHCLGKREFQMSPHPSNPWSKKQDPYITLGVERDFLHGRASNDHQVRLAIDRTTAIETMSP